MSRLVTLVALVALTLPAVASAEECIYEDNRGHFTFAVDCAQLQDYTGMPAANHLQRVWVYGPLGELNVLDVPEPYETVPLKDVTTHLGRYWTKTRTIIPLAETTIAGQEALVVTERKLRTTSRTWVFKIGGQNVMARAVTYGKRKEREVQLEELVAVFEKGLKLNE
jgi:hypothetical protein